MRILKGFKSRVLKLQILKEKLGHFLEMRILKGLVSKLARDSRQAIGRRNPDGGQATTALDLRDCLKVPKERATGLSPWASLAIKMWAPICADGSVRRVLGCLG